MKKLCALVFLAFCGSTLAQTASLAAEGVEYPAGSETDGGQTVWDAVLGYVKNEQPVALSQIKRRFRNDEPSVVSGVLNDLVGSGFVYRSGRGEGAVFRLADAQDFERSSAESRRYFASW